MLEAHVRTDVVVLVSFREDLRAELAAQISVRGQLRDQDALVVAGHTVGGVGRHVPTAAEGAVDDQVVACFKFLGPCADWTTWDGRDEGSVLLTSAGRTVQSQGDVGVEFQIWHLGKHRRVQHSWSGPTHGVLVEAGGGVQLQGEFFAAGEAGHHVAGRGQVEVHAVRLHAGQFTVEVLGHQFEAHAVSFSRRAEVKFRRARRAVVDRQGVVQDQLVRTLHGVALRDGQFWRRGVFHSDGLHQRGGVASVVGGRECAHHLVAAHAVSVDAHAAHLLHDHRAAVVGG